MAELDVLVKVMATPNPNAYKFVSNFPVKNSGKASFANVSECGELRLCKDLFLVSGVSKLHLYDNVVTVTFEDQLEENAKKEIESILKTRLPVHDPNFELESEKLKDRSHFTDDMLKIEEILDRTIRPALQADGGDIDIVSYKDKVLEVEYLGACGNCPSSMFGTLEAIRGILQDEFDDEIDIIIADD